MPFVTLISFSIALFGRCSDTYAIHLTLAVQSFLANPFTAFSNLEPDPAFEAYLDGLRLAAMFDLESESLQSADAEDVAYLASPRLNPVSTG
jgi:hypothetical protein